MNYARTLGARKVGRQMKFQKLQEWVDDTKERLELEANQERIDRAEKEQQERLRRIELIKRKVGIQTRQK